MVVHFRLSAPAPARSRRLPHTHTQLVPHNLLTHTQLVHTQLVHTQLVPTQLTHTQHLATWTCILRGRRGTYRAGLAFVARLGPVGRRGRRRRLRGRHGTSRHRPSLCVAGVALMAPTTCPPSASAVHAHTHCAHTRMHTHTHIHTLFHARFYHTHTYTPLLRTIAYTPFTHLPSTYICCTRRSFTISFLFPASPTPSLPFFCCLLEEVDMWGYPVL